MYEAGIFNQQVRDAMANDVPHQLSDAWADINYITLTATSLFNAKQLFELKYPAARGFVIDCITEAY